MSGPKHLTVHKLYAAKGKMMSYMIRLEGQGCRMLKRCRLVQGAAGT
jgi:hypothetical protein